jgi:hypothetical protein
MMEHREEHATLDNLWDMEGTYAMRQKAIDLAPDVDALWDHLNGDQYLLDGVTFDWEFIPALLGFVNWREGGWTVGPDYLRKTVFALVAGPL